MKSVALPPRDDLRERITGALEKLGGPHRGGRVLSASGGRGLLLSAVTEGRPIAEAEHKALAGELLQEARKALDEDPDPITVAGFFNNDSIALSLVLSQIAEKQAAPKGPGVLKDLTGTDRYELLDPGWWASVANRLTHKRVPFIGHSSPMDFRVEITEQNPTLAMVGDWGTGLPSSLEIARHMTALNPSITIHLGDVYYSGTKQEVETRFLPEWPSGSIGTFAINSNHEMYAGGEGYFGLTLQKDVFSRHQKASYFCVSAPGWQVIGLDSAYEAPDLLYQKGRLSAAQLSWLQAQLAEGARRGQRSIVLTHHNPLDAHGGTDQGLLDQMLKVAEPHPFDFWYWAHEHIAARFAPFGPSGRQFLGRCVGHGGVPYAPEHTGNVGNGITVEWTETELAGDQEEPRRAKNGFVLLALDSTAKTLEETFFDESGVKKSAAKF